MHMKTWDKSRASQVKKICPKSLSLPHFQGRKVGKILLHTLHWNNKIIPALGINPGFPSPRKAKFWGLTFHWNQIFRRILWSTFKEYLDFGAHFTESIGSFSHLHLGIFCDNPGKSHWICSAKEGNNASANRFLGIEAGSGSYFPFPQRVWLQRTSG